MKDAVLIDELKDENSALKSENSVLRSELTELNSKLSWLMEQISGNNRKLFGVSSEQSAYDQIGIFEENTQKVKLVDDVKQEPKQRPIKKGELSSRLPADMPVEIIECELPSEERDCPSGHGQMDSIGKELVRRELKITPAKAVVRELWRHSYLCKSCEKESEDGSSTIYKAELPPQLIKGSMCAPETVAHLIVEKCVMGSPLYRQEQQWNRLGLKITRQTMANWLIKCSEDYLEPIYDELHRQLCQQKFLHSDETSFQVLREPGKSAQSKSSMWVYRTSGDAEHPIVLYDYQPDKTKKRPGTFLEGFFGYLMTDGCASYHSLPTEIIVVGCFAHCRRKFDEALKVIKDKAEQVGSLALVGKEYCNELFKIEREMGKVSFEERYTIRIEKAKPVLDEFHAWLLSVQPGVASQSKIGKAINYALNQWKYLERYLLDGCIEISNNRCERSVKPFVINRKNFLFATSVAGARAAAVLHSITETAKENNLNPHEYLSHIFRTAAGINLRDNHDMISALLPENAPEECRIIE